MAYSELIKNFDRIRDYMRDFYVYGFKRRDEFGGKSARSYDNERRRIESWLGEYMSFRQEAGGKSVFLSIDSRGIVRNPLYKAFKAKSFTVNDLILHFYLLDFLCDGEQYTVPALMDRLTEALSAFENHPEVDESTLRGKLREYERLGLVCAEKHGRQLKYCVSKSDVPLPAWADALHFFAEEDPLGFVGSTLLDKLPETAGYFQFKHHYILHAMESEVLCLLLEAISERRRVELDLRNPRRGAPSTRIVTPLNIYISSQGGRRYLLALPHHAGKITLYRLDSIRSVKAGEPDAHYEAHSARAKEVARHLWGASTGDGELEYIEMTLLVDKGEEYIISRLQREKRCGEVRQLDASHWLFSAEVYDAMELMPWIRTFIGRISNLACSNQSVRETFLRDLRATEALYVGGDADAVQ